MLNNGTPSPPSSSIFNIANNHVGVGFLTSSTLNYDKVLDPLECY